MTKWRHGASQIRRRGTSSWTRLADTTILWLGGGPGCQKPRLIAAFSHDHVSVNIRMAAV